MIFAVETAHIEKSKLYAVISFNGGEVDRFLLTEMRNSGLSPTILLPGSIIRIEEIDGTSCDKSDNSPRAIASEDRVDPITWTNQSKLTPPMLIEIVSNPTEAEIDVLARIENRPLKKVLQPKHNWLVLFYKPILFLPWN